MELIFKNLTGKGSSTTSASFHTSRINLMQKYLNLDNKLVLDLGCGTGEYDYFLNKRGMTVISCDVSIPSINIAFKLNSNPHYVLTDAENLPFKRSSINIIFINEVLEHLNNDSKCISETYRVLYNNGYIVIYAPNKFFPWETHLRLGKFPFLFLSYLPMNVRKKIFQIFGRNYVSIYTRKTIYKKLEQFYYIIDYKEILPRIKLLQNKKYYYKIEKMIDKLSNTPLHIFGISIFFIAKKLN